MKNTSGAFDVIQKFSPELIFLCMLQSTKFGFKRIPLMQIENTHFFHHFALHN